MNQLQVLTADADENILRQLETALAQRSGIRVAATAKSSYEAVGKAYIIHPQIILMETVLETPQAGLLALREITHSLPECRVIFYSSIQSAEIVCRAYAGGAVNYLFKPASDSSIVHAVQAAGAGRGYINSDSATLLLADYQRVKRLEQSLGMLLRSAMLLTATERALLKLLVEGMKPREIEKIRFIEHSTMKTHLSHITRKFGMDTINEVVRELKSVGFFEFIGEE